MTKRMTSWKTDATQGLIVGVVLMLVIILVDVGLILLALDYGENTIGTFFVGLAIIYSFRFLFQIGYWLDGLVRSSYLLDRNALIIRWGAIEYTIPMASVECIMTGDEIEGRIRFHGVSWPGYQVGYGQLPGDIPALFFATLPPRHQIYLVTSDMAYGISPADREAFLESLVQRIEMGPTQAVEAMAKRPAFMDWALWRDRPGMIGLGLGALASLALIGFICFRFEMLPARLPLHFDAAGNPDWWGERGHVFMIPLIGLLSLAVNTLLGALVYRYEKIVSYLLWGGTLLIQILVWIAALNALQV